MKLEDLKTITQLAEFLSGTQAVAFSIILGKEDCYRWTQKVLYEFHYRELDRQDKGILIRYLMKISGYSRQQGNKGTVYLNGNKGTEIRGQFT